MNTTIEAVLTEIASRAQKSEVALSPLGTAAKHAGLPDVDRIWGPNAMLVESDGPGSRVILQDVVKACTLEAVRPEHFRQFANSVPLPTKVIDVDLISDDLSMFPVVVQAFEPIVKVLIRRNHEGTESLERDWFDLQRCVTHFTRRDVDAPHEEGVILNAETANAQIELPRVFARFVEGLSEQWMAQFRAGTRTYTSIFVVPLASINSNLSRVYELYCVLHKFAHPKVVFVASAYMISFNRAAAEASGFYWTEESVNEMFRTRIPHNQE